MLNPHEMGLILTVEEVKALSLILNHAVWSKKEEKILRGSLGRNWENTLHTFHEAAKGIGRDEDRAYEIRHHVFSTPHAKVGGNDE